MKIKMLMDLIPMSIILVAGASEGWTSDSSGNRLGTLSDATAITATRINTYDSSVTGFYIATIYTAAADCTGATSSPDMFKNGFIGTPFAVSVSSSFVIGQQALYQTFVNSYKAATTLKPPSDTTTRSVMMNVITFIDNSGPSGGTWYMTSDIGLTTQQCFVLTCNHTTHTCTSSPTTVYY